MIGLGSLFSPAVGPANAIASAGFMQTLLDGGALQAKKRAAQYSLDLPNAGQLILRGDYSHQSRIFFSSFEVRELSQQEYGWLKARVTYVAPDSHWQLAAFIDNITDEKVISNATYIADIVDSTITGNMAPPRTYGAQFKYHF